MGPLSVRAGTQAYLEAQAIIFSVEHHPLYWPKLKQIWDRAADGDVRLFTSEFSLLECLVQPERRGEEQLISDFETIFDSPSNLAVVPLERRLLRSAAKLRATHQWMKSPDSIHIATAIGERADVDHHQ